MSSAKRVIYATTLCSAFTLAPQLVSADSFTISADETVTNNRYLDDLNETGTIDAEGRMQITNQSAIDSTGENNSIQNDGVIEVSNTTNTSFAGINAEGYGVDITNVGSISTNGNYVSGIILGGEDADLVNNGTITTTGFNSRGLVISSNGASVTNTGTISTSGSGDSVGIFVGGLGSSIINSGTIKVAEGAAIDGNGNINLMLESGSQIIGDISFGGENNTLTTMGTMTLDDNIFDAGAFTSETELGDEQIFNGVISGADTSLNIKGEGKVFLNGDNDYQGTTTISGGTLQLGNGGSFGSGDVINNGDLIFNGYHDVTGDISGTGNLTLQGSGSIYLTGNNSYSGTTTIISETSLWIGNSGTSGTLGEGDTFNEGSMVFNRSDSLTYGGDISGNGSLYQYGTDTLTLTGNINNTTYIESGTLQIGDGGTNGTVGNVSNKSALIFNRSDAVNHVGIISGTGSLTKQGSGTLRLAGENTYTGNTLINAGTLSISNNNNLGDSSARLIFDGGTLETTADLTISSGRNIRLNSGGGTIDTGDNAVTYNGNFASNGGLTKLGSGTFEHTGYSGYTGVTTIAEGTLKISHLSKDGDYINNGTLIFNKETGTGSNMYLNGLSGAGSLIKEGGGILLLNGDKTYTGNTYINNGFIQAQGKNALGVNGAVTVAENGQLDIWTNLSIGSLAGKGTINLSNRYGGSIGNTLTVGGDDTSTAFKGMIFGNGGGLTKTGEGTLTLAGINTYTGSTTVNNGLLEVNSSLASEVTINYGGTLGGRGHLGSVLVSGGRLAPGNSIGTLNVASVDFSGDGVYEVEVDAAGNTDLLNVTGTAMLTGGSVQVIPEDGDYQPSTDYTILTAGTIEGQFDSVSSTLAFLDPTLSYDTNKVMLRLDRNNQSFASVAGTSNQLAVAQTLDTLSQTTNVTLLTDNLLLLTADGANSAYDSLSGVQHSNTQQLQNRVGQQFRGLLSRRMNAPVSFALGNELTQFATIADVEALPATAAGGLNPTRGFWLEGMGGQGDIDGDRNAGGVDYDFYGVAGGVDMEVAQDWVAGAAFGYTRTDADIDNGGLDVDSYMAALYGAWQPSAFYLNGNLTFGLHSTDASRQVVVGTFSERAESDYDSVSVQAAVEAGQTLQTTAAGFDVTPFVGLEAFTDSRESFTESGAGVANLDVDRERMESLQSSLGLRFENTWTTESGKTLMPMLQVAWVHEYLDETATLNAGFAAAPGSRFSVEGPELDRNRARVGAGIAAKLSDASQLTMGYQGEFAGSDDNHTVSARFRMEW